MLKRSVFQIFLRNCQIYGNFSAILKHYTILVKTALVSVWVIWKHWAFFHFNCLIKLEVAQKVYSDTVQHGVHCLPKFKMHYKENFHWSWYVPFSLVNPGL